MITKTEPIVVAPRQKIKLIDVISCINEQLKELNLYPLKYKFSPGTSSEPKPHLQLYRAPDYHDTIRRSFLHLIYFTFKVINPDSLQSYYAVYGPTSESIDNSYIIDGSYFNYLQDLINSFAKNESFALANKNKLSSNLFLCNIIKHGLNFHGLEFIGKTKASLEGLSAKLKELYINFLGPSQYHSDVWRIEIQFLDGIEEEIFKQIQDYLALKQVEAPHQKVDEEPSMASAVGSFFATPMTSKSDMVRVALIEEPEATPSISLDVDDSPDEKNTCIIG